jgi:hypothetical protein
MRSSLLVLATLALLAGGTIEAVGQSEPAPTDGSAAGNTPVASPIHAGADATAVQEWMVVQPRLKAARDVSFEAIATLPTGEAVAVGHGTERERPARAFALDRLDPAAWQPVSLPGRKRAVTVDIASQDGELIAVGTGLPKDGPPQVLIWRSTDGRSWQRPARLDDAEVRDVLATDDGVALLGETRDDTRRSVPTLWRSTDGRTFEADPVAEAGHMARRVARSPAGIWIVVGARKNEDGYMAEYVLWRSDDGADWETVELAFADPTRLMDVVAAEWTPSGFILVVALDLAENDGASGQIWHSPEGHEWTRVATSDVPFGAVASSPSRQVVFGSRLGGPVSDPLAAAPVVVYDSSDGLDWEASRYEELDGVHVTAATMTPSGEVVGIGSRSHTKARDGAIDHTVRPIVILSSAGDDLQAEQPPE